MMERLTKKQENKYWLNCSYDEQDAIQQLGKLENLQDELGITLEVLFKALKDGIYHIRYDSIFVDLTVTLKGNIVFQDSDNNLISLKDYGKTWWLEKPKGELENAKD